MVTCTAILTYLQKVAATCLCVPKNELIDYFNPLQTKRRQLYLKNQSVPRCKHFSSRL